ncbi:MAG: enoyl-CoA hydratase/isomerase family protein [Elusimicrobia bacterium]|nr:enoyl-CoA hydratase/isomerase family protein [Elusimicrobiota bacterium]
MSADSQEILIERQGVVLTITLNRPQAMNALTAGMLAALKKTLREASGDVTLKAVVLTGMGRGFCVGADLSDFKKRVDAGQMLGFRKELDDNFHPVAKMIRSMPQIVIGRINGTCAGAGLALALVCDIKFAPLGTGFVGAFAKVGLAPDTGSSYLVTHAMGYSKAMEFFLTKGRATAEDLAACGLINKAVSPEALDQEVEAAIKELSELPAQAIVLTKRALQFASQARYFDEALAYEAAAQEYLGRTADHAEGLAAFLEKRKPVYTGK